MKLLGRRYDTGAAVCVHCEGAKIGRIEPLSAPPADDLPWLAPGLIDIQINGYGGQEFSSPDLTEEKVARIVEALTPFGVARFCPTVTTEGYAVLSHALRTIAKAWESMPAVACRMAGIHLEGPYVAQEDGPRGAHPRAHCRAPDWDEFQRLQEAAQGKIRLLTVSPEYDNACDFIQRVVESGVVVSIGHTAATPAQVHAGAAAGARFSTHLGNGAHPILARHPNYIWAQLADDRLVAGLIADGHHLPADVVKAMIRCKTPERCVLVSDLSGLAGLPPGRYKGNLCEAEILPDGKLVVAGQRAILAGATFPITNCVLNAMEFAELTMEKAVNMATLNPARLLGLEGGDLHEGSRADLVLFRVPAADQPGPRALQVATLVVGGQVVYGA